MSRLGRTTLVALAFAHLPIAASQDKQTVTLAIDKMFCVLCGITVKKALGTVEGVEDVQVDVSKKVAVVKFDATKATVDDLTRATAKAGFPAVASVPMK